MILPVDIENMNSKMQVDKLCLIKKIPQNTRSHCPFKPTTLCCLTLFLWYPPHALFPMMHLFSLCCGIYKGFDCIISGFPGRSGVVPCWLSSKRRENALFVLLKKKKKFEKKRKPHRSSDSGVLCGPLCRHHAWKWNRWKSEILVTEFVERCLSDGVCNYD